MLESSFDLRERVDDVEDEELDTEPAAAKCIRGGITPVKVVFSGAGGLPDPKCGELIWRMRELPELLRLGVLVKA
jgi:hypothetical protein